MRVQQNYRQVQFEPNIPVNVIVRRMNYFCAHWHNQAELLYIVSGSALIHVDGEDCPLREGEMMFVCGSEIHSIARSRDKCLLIILQFDAEFFRSLFGAEPCRFNRGAFARDQSSAAQAGFFSPGSLGLLLSAIVWEYSKRQPGFTFFISSLALRLLGQLIRGGYLTLEPPLTAPRYESIRRMNVILDYIGDHYRENITLQSIAREVHVSYYYLSRSFKEVTGMSFREHLSQVRVQKSLPALQSTKDSIHNIALASGFPTARSYAGAFQSRYGLTPAEYRRAKQRPSGIDEPPPSVTFSPDGSPSYAPANNADDLERVFAMFDTAAMYAARANIHNPYGSMGGG
ncbi:MAG: AraC family transcriptional regulator [Oscillospiraceae bacterium]|jgi:xylan 1,4-beta-xylosidase|nr:AraC family transcriptional regulator [Oscillospiraceae bacterium]